MSTKILVKLFCDSRIAYERCQVSIDSTGELAFNRYGSVTIDPIVPENWTRYQESGYGSSGETQHFCPACAIERKVTR